MDDLPKKKRNTNTTDGIRQYINNEMKKMTSKLKELIEVKWPQGTVSVSTIKWEKQRWIVCVLSQIIKTHGSESHVN